VGGSVRCGVLRGVKDEGVLLDVATGGCGRRDAVGTRRDDGLQEQAASALAPLLLLLRAGVLAVDLADQVVEDLLDVDLVLRGRLQERTPAETLRELLPLLRRDDALLREIALVSNENHRDIVAVLDSQDLFPQVLKVIECGLCNNTVHQDEPLTIFHVQISHGRELFRPGRIQYLKHAPLSIYLHLLPVTVLNGWVILLHKDALDELYSKGTLAHTSRPQHDNLELSERHA